MSEFIPLTPENETTQDRFEWDGILRALDVLCDLDDSLDRAEIIDDLKDETLEDRLTLLFNYVVMIEVTEGQSDKLEGVMDFLKENGIMEGWS